MVVKVTGGITTTTVGVGMLAALVLMAGGCRQLNASHCGNQQGNLTCEQRDMNARFCSLCEAANDGCVATLEQVELGCGFGTSPESTSVAETTSPAESSTGAASTGDIGLDSSSSGPPNLCGNGMIDGDETCDGTVPEGTPDCAAMGYGEGMPACQDDCTITYMPCPTYMEECGNGEVGEAEECDGTNFANQTCDDFTNKTGDGLLCTDDCLFNTTNCMTCVETDEPCELMGMPCCNGPEETCVGLLGQRRCCVGNGLGGCV